MKTYRISIKGREYEVVVGELESSPVTVTVDGVEYQVDLPDGEASTPVRRAGPSSPPPAAKPTAAPPRPAAPSPGAGGSGSIRAMMPGKILSVSVSVGQGVTAGQTVLVMESMKMENTITATQAGTVTAVLVGEGDSVQHGQTLIEIDA